MVAGFDIPELAAMAVLGLVAGTLGGMLGVGGSVVMIPGLTIILGYNQHLYQAAAMVANVAVSVPAMMRHYQAGAMTPGPLRWILSAATVFVLAGVWLSNIELFRGSQGGLWLGRVLAVFLVYVGWANLRQIIWPGGGVFSEPQGAEQHSMAGVPWRGSAVGTLMGLNAGLLGVGGGAIAVPLQQVFLRLPLRSCIANSSAVICVSAALGAVYKNATLGQHGYDWHDSIVLALVLSPTCWLGGHCGAVLTHRLPVRQVRAAFVGLMALAALKMAAIF